MIELAAIIGIIAGWIFRMTYSTVRLKELTEENARLEKQNKEIEYRYKMNNAFLRGYSGLPYAD